VSINPTTASFVNGVWTGQITVAQAAANMYLRVDDGAAGHSANSNTFNVVPAAPSAPDLLAASDTGFSSTDNVTKLNNSSAGTKLGFSVGNTVAGATVTVYASGIVIGSTVASGATTLVTTDGATALPEGDVSVTAIQMLGGNPSAASSPLSIRIDTIAPVLTANSVTTSDPAPPLNGTVNESGAAVTVMINGHTYAARTSSARGTWGLLDDTIDALTPGIYLMDVTATDDAGNIGTTSATITIISRAAPQPVAINDDGTAADGAPPPSMVQSLALNFDQPLGKTLVIALAGPDIVGGSLADGLVI
jgi:hypothetical protein